MSKFKIGDKVRPKLNVIKWYLSDEGQEIYWPASGILNHCQERALDSANIAMLAMALDNTLVGEVVAHHFSNSISENYKVLILEKEFNIQPQHLIRKYIMSKKSISNGREWTKREITFLESKYKLGYSRTEISKLYAEKYAKEGLTRSPDSIKHAIEAYCQHIDKDLPKVLYIDIETKPMKAFVWNQWENNVSLDMLIEDGSILSFCAKWAGDPDSKVIYMDQRGKEKNLMNDKALMQAIWKLLDEADIVVGQNSNRFDLPKINARFIAHGLGAPSAYKKIDTLLLARSNFSFFSNKLAHLSGMLAKKNKKDEHKDFPGFSLWAECLKGNKKAWAAMKKYNIVDVLSLEEVFLELAKYVKNNKTVTAALRVYGK